MRARARHQAMFKQTGKEPPKRRFQRLASLPAPASTTQHTARLADWLEVWIADRIEPSHALSTVQRYRSIAHRVADELGNPSLSEVSTARIAGLYRQLMATDEQHRGLTSNTLIAYHAVLRQGFGYAVELGMIAQNPVIPPPKPGRRIMPIALSPVQVDSLLAACERFETRVLVALIVRTGLRRGECYALRWTDVDLVGQALRVRRSLQRFPVLGYKVVEPKTPHSFRTIALSEAMSALLLEHRGHQEREARESGRTWLDDWLVFGDSNGEPQSWYYYWGQFDRARRGAGFPDLRLHDLRHTAASLMMQAGVHPKVMSARLGHSSIQVTLDTYSHVLPHMETGAADAVEEVLRRDALTARTVATA